MSRFLDPLRLELVKPGGWRLLAILRYESALLTRTVTVPCGFATDLASVPRLPLVYWSVGARATVAAVVHDFLYQTHWAGDVKLERSRCDAVFYEAMVVANDPAREWQRTAMWAGVRVGGEGPYQHGRVRFLEFRNHLVCPLL